MSDSFAKTHLRPMAPIQTCMKKAGSLHKPVRCLICDLYGTLIISGSGDIGAIGHNADQLSEIDRLLFAYGLSMPAAQLLDTLFTTIDRQLAQKRSAGIEHPEIRIEKIWHRIVPSMPDARLKRLAVELEMILNPVWMMPHARELLDACRLKGIRLGIISNAQFYTAPVFKSVFGSDWFEFGFDCSIVILSYLYGRAKPDPLLFAIARQNAFKKGIAERQTAFIGNDMRNDIVPAAQAGFQTILFAGDKRSLRLRENDRQCRSTKPNLVVTDLQQLIVDL